MLTAEYGGTGGKDLVGGMIVEEPDIEIGAGVSSKGKALLECTLLSVVTDALDSNQQTYGNRQRRPARPTLDSRRPRQLRSSTPAALPSARARQS